MEDGCAWGTKGIWSLPAHEFPTTVNLHLKNLSQHLHKICQKNQSLGSCRNERLKLKKWQNHFLINVVISLRLICRFFLQAWFPIYFPGIKRFYRKRNIKKSPTSSVTIVKVNQKNSGNWDFSPMIGKNKEIQTSYKWLAWCQLIT